MLLLRFLYNWLVLFYFFSDCTDFFPTAELIIPTGIATDEANAKIELQPVTE